jgi:hypothetical protein
VLLFSSALGLRDLEASPDVIHWGAWPLARVVFNKTKIVLKTLPRLPSVWSSHDWRPSADLIESKSLQCIAARFSLLIAAVHSFSPSRFTFIQNFWVFYYFSLSRLCVFIAMFFFFHSEWSARLFFLIFLFEFRHTATRNFHAYSLIVNRSCTTPFQIVLKHIFHTHWSWNKIKTLPSSTRGADKLKKSRKRIFLYFFLWEKTSVSLVTNFEWERRGKSR